MLEITKSSYKLKFEGIERNLSIASREKIKLVCGRKNNLQMQILIKLPY